MLCLVQAAANGHLAVIDALAVGDMGPFWEAIVAEGRQIVVHAGRGELEFCLQATGRLPEPGLFDVQVAAGSTGIEEPRRFRRCWCRRFSVSCRRSTKPAPIGGAVSLACGNRIRPGRRRAPSSALRGPGGEA